MLDELDEGLVPLGLLLEGRWLGGLALEIQSEMGVPLHVEEDVDELGVAILPLGLVLVRLDTVYLFKESHEQ